MIMQFEDADHCDEVMATKTTVTHIVNLMTLRMRTRVLARATKTCW